MAERRYSLQRIRTARGFSRRELAEKSGVNYRSIQDYEQGHKPLSGAKADTLLRLSLSLGCTMEQLLEESVLGEEIPDRDVRGEAMKRRLVSYQGRYREVRRSDFEALEIYCEEYRTYGAFRVTPTGNRLIFMYAGERVEQPFDAVVNERTLPWLGDIGGMMIFDYIEEQEFRKNNHFRGGENYEQYLLSHASE